jgi:hypothetical protein
MGLADSAALRLEALEPVVIALTERVTEEMLIALAGKNPEYRFDTTADGRLAVSPLTGFFASGGEAQFGRQIRNWNAEKRLRRVTSSSGGFTLADNARSRDRMRHSSLTSASQRGRRSGRSGLSRRSFPTLYSSCFLRRSARRTRPRNAKTMWRREAISRS